MRPIIPAVLVSAAALSTAHADRTVYVNATLNTGANNGTSWADAYRGRLGLQAALLDSAVGDEIWVAQGEYTPAGPNGARSASFALRSGVAIFGGFAGNETARIQRNPDSRPTTLTGDLNADGSTDQAAAENSFHVVVGVGVDAAAQLDGFTITGGVTDPNTTTLAASGGAIQLLSGSAATIRGCTFASNFAQWRGGDIAVVDSSPTIDACSFTGTSSCRTGLCISVSGNSAAIVRGCNFIGSPLTTGGTAGVGIYSDSTAPSGITVEDCLFSMKTTMFSCPAGVGMYISANSRANVRTSRFIDNLTCGGGGGIHCDGTGTIDRCVFVGNEGQFDGGAALFSFQGETTVTNSLFVGNDRAGFSTIAAQGVMHFVNCTFASNGKNNSTHFVINTGAAGSTFANCVFWGNKSSAGDAAAVALPTTPAQLPRFDSCLVQGWNGTLPGSNSFAGDPMFVSIAGADGVLGTIDDDLRLSVGSPAIDRGSNLLLLAGQSADLDGAPRRRDDPFKPDLGIGLSPVVDLGAYERHPACASDFDWDGFVTGDDFDSYVAAFEAGSPAADFDGDGFVTGDDFDAYVAAFEAGC